MDLSLSILRLSAIDLSLSIEKKRRPPGRSWALGSLEDSSGIGCGSTRAERSGTRETGTTHDRSAMVHARKRTCGTEATVRSVFRSAAGARSGTREEAPLRSLGLRDLAVSSRSVRCSPMTLPRLGCPKQEARRADSAHRDRARHLDDFPHVERPRRRDPLRGVRPASGQINSVRNPLRLPRGHPRTKRPVVSRPFPKR